MSYEELVILLSKYTDQTIEKESRVREDLALTSFDMMFIIYEIEEIIGNEIDISLYHSNMSVNDLYEIIERM